MKMDRMTGQQVADKWAERLGSATKAITDGVNAVDVAPGQKAAAKKAEYVAGVTRNQNKWARKVGAVTLEQWKTAMLRKAVPIIASRAIEAKGKVKAFFDEFLSHLQLVQSQLNSSPRGTIDQNIARAVLVIRANAAFGAQRAEK